MTFKNAQEALIDQPSMDAIRLILWQRDMTVAYEQSEEGSSIRRILMDSILLVQSLVLECQKYRDPELKQTDTQVSDLLTMKPLFDELLSR